MKDSADLTAPQIAELLPNRTVAAIRVARQKLLRGNVHPSGQSPYQMTDRPLVARTCRVCGLLLDASWFTFMGDRWRSRCNRCLTQERKERGGPVYNPTAEQRRIYRDNWANAIAYVQERATNTGKEWTDHDYAVLLNPHLSLLEKALELGRTYNAIYNKALPNGATSRRENGRGEPVESWVITLPADTSCHLQGVAS